MSEHTWLGHENGCCSQWSDYCDCIDPNNPIDLSVPDEIEPECPVLDLFNTTD